jgi:hypothetical protein
MGAQLEQAYQDIGRIAVANADGLSGKLLVYAEVEEGVISNDLFYENQNGVVRFLIGPPQLRETIYAFWQAWREEPENVEWRTMTYIVDAGKFGVDFRYPEQVNALEDVSDRRPLVVKHHFGNAPVDYSKPR